MEAKHTYPLTFSVDYPERALSRVSTFFRAFTTIPILILLGTLTNSDWSFSGNAGSNIEYGASGSFAAGGTGGLLVMPPLLMLLFRQKYPEWWAD